MKENSTLVYLHYRYVETSVSYTVPGETPDNASGGNGMTTESLAAKVGQVISGLFGRSSAGNTEIPAAVTFANRKWNTPQEDGKDKVQLVLTKNWADFNNQFGTRPDTLNLTLKRRADAQPGQSNAIDWKTVTDSTLTEDKSVINQWKYIWSGLDRYAPNGMPWIYRVSEEKPAAYQASGNGSVQFGSTGNPSQTAEITNSLQTTAKFTKQWTDKAGKTVTNDYLGYDLTASFKLQAATSSDASFDAFLLLMQRQQLRRLQPQSRSTIRRLPGFLPCGEEA